MLKDFQMVWDTFGEIVAALPDRIVIVVSFVLFSVGIVSVLRSL